MSTNPHGPKTKISEITVANERLYEEVARLTRQDKREVQEQVEFIGEFVASTIKDGQMQGVMIPYFGKFKPKERELIAIKAKQSSTERGLNEVVKALKGIPLGPSTKTIKKAYKSVGKADNTNNNETI